jgi:hypothetical protein
MPRNEFYRQCARRLRDIAVGYNPEEIKERLERAAKKYEQLAEQVERVQLGRG